MKKEHRDDAKLRTKKRILFDKTKKSLLDGCCYYFFCFKEFIITGKTSNVYFAKLILIE